MIEISEIKTYLKSNLSERRYLHSFGVAEEAEKLANTYGADAEKAYIAGLVHDCAKEFSADKMLSLFEKYGGQADEIMKAMPNLLHGPLGAYFAKDVFKIEGADIFDAIYYHTTGKADMPLLTKIVYIADYIEPNRTYDGVEELKELAYRDIDKAIVFGIDFTIQSLINRKLPIHLDTVSARNFLISSQEK